MNREGGRESAAQRQAGDKGRNREDMFIVDFNFGLTVTCHFYLSVVMAKKKKPYIPPPDPRNFNDPITRGWHVLSDDGWYVLQPSATLQLPPSFGAHNFRGEVAGWSYEYQLSDGQGIQRNLDTNKERDVKWFGTPTTAVSGDSDSELKLREELEEERRLRREAEAMVVTLRTELEALRAQVGGLADPPTFAIEDEQPRSSWE